MNYEEVTLLRNSLLRQFAPEMIRTGVSMKLSLIGEDKYRLDFLTFHVPEDQINIPDGKSRPSILRKTQDRFAASDEVVTRAKDAAKECSREAWSRELDDSELHSENCYCYSRGF